MSLPRPFNEPGPILSYLSKLRNAGHADQAAKAQEAVRTLLGTPDGSILLELLEVSTSLSLTGILQDERALAARNSQSFIASDLRRIMTDETEQLLDRQANISGGSRR